MDFHGALCKIARFSDLALAPIRWRQDVSGVLSQGVVGRTPKRFHPACVVPDAPANHAEER
jgi:hypothetical protein